MIVAAPITTAASAADAIMSQPREPKPPGSTPLPSAMWKGGARAVDSRRTRVASADARARRCAAPRTAPSARPARRPRHRLRRRLRGSSRRRARRAARSTAQAGAPIASSSQASTGLASARPSPAFVRLGAATYSGALRGCSWRVDAGRSKQNCANSSSPGRKSSWRAAPAVVNSGRSPQRRFASACARRER